MARLTPPGTPPDQPPTEIVIDHPIWRRAPHIAVALGLLAALGVAFGDPDAPWWMPLLAFCVVAAVVWRLLRPRLRRLGWEDEL